MSREFASRFLPPSRRGRAGRVPLGAATRIGGRRTQGRRGGVQDEGVRVACPRVNLSNERMTCSFSEFKNIRLYKPG